jgi:hypothetical protein
LCCRLFGSSSAGSVASHAGAVAAIIQVDAELDHPLGESLLPATQAVHSAIWRQRALGTGRRRDTGGT